MTAGAAVAAPPAAAGGIPSVSFADSGYTICRSARGDHLVFDAGPHGFLNGGHAHADALSIALTVAGRPLFVDAGTGSYTVDPPARDRFRSSALHNTVVVGGRSQSLPDGPFHWAHVAHGRRGRWAPGRGFDYVEGRHDGYAPIGHERTVFARPGCWVVRDRLTGAGAVDAAVHWHLDPRWAVAPDRDGWLLATDGDGAPVWIAAADGDLEIVSAGSGASGLGWVAPAYGRLVPTVTLRRAVAAAAPVEIVTVIVEGHERPALEVPPVRMDHETVPGASAIRLRSARGVDTLVFRSGPEREGRAALRLCRAADLETDAAFAWHHAPAGGGAEAAAIIDGSTLRVDERAVIAHGRATSVVELP
jgi:hypothetical protein